MTQIEIATRVLTEIIRYEKPEIADSLSREIENLIEHRLNPPLMTIERIKLDVAEMFDIPISNYNQKKRVRETRVLPTQLAHTIAYFCLNHKGISLPVIGRVIGNKDHATVLWSIKKISGYMQVDFYFRDRFKDIFIKYGILDKVMNYNNDRAL